MSKSEITVPAPSNDVEPHRSLSGAIQVDGLEAERDSARTALADAVEAVEYWKAEALANSGPS